MVDKKAFLLFLIHIFEVDPSVTHFEPATRTEQNMVGYAPEGELGRYIELALTQQPPNKLIQVRLVGVPRYQFYGHCGDWFRP